MQDQLIAEMQHLIYGSERTLKRARAERERRMALEQFRESPNRHERRKRAALKRKATQ